MSSLPTDRVCSEDRKLGLVVSVLSSEGSTTTFVGISTGTAEVSSSTTCYVGSAVVSLAVAMVATIVFSTLLSEDSVTINPRLAFFFGLARVLHFQIPTIFVFAIRDSSSKVLFVTSH